MPTASESRAALQLITSAAVAASTTVLQSLSGSGQVQRADLLDAVPEIIAYYSDGSAALAADFYDDEREAAAAASRFSAEPIILDRTEKIRRAIAWSAQPLIDGVGHTSGRLAEVVQIETARPYRDTVTTNLSRDSEAKGWRRVTHGGCGFCRMLADKGAVYRKEMSARFASHPNCHCGAQPVFGSDAGPEASVIQYVASKRRSSAADRQRVREYLAAHYGDH